MRFEWEKRRKRFDHKGHDGTQRKRNDWRAIFDIRVSRIGNWESGIVGWELGIANVGGRIEK
jgi:hypothetical protein